MISISFFPVVEEEMELVDILSRAAWFLSFCPLDRIFVPIGSEHLTSMPARVAQGMDESIGGKFEALLEKLEFVMAREESDLQKCMSQAAIILRWKKDMVPTFVSQSTVASWEMGKRVLQVDPAAIRQEGGFYIDVSFSLMKDRAKVIEENRIKFERLTKRLGKFQRAFLMATGPSVSNYRHLDFSDSLSIVCNSVILDEDLMETVRPQILVFADPIFHFGPSQYAGAFRQKLSESARKNDFTICIPLKYYPIFTAAMPELAERTIGIPFAKERAWNFDLTSEFTLKTTANILTFLMVPLATTFADEIGFLGCNGRPLNENTYFWNHSPSTQINDKMSNIREVHPGFFNIDYNDYYLEHCQTLEQQLSDGEKAGKKFVSLGFSHIPALNRRLGRNKLPGAALVGSRLNAIVIARQEVSPTNGETACSHFEEQALTSVGAAVKRIYLDDIEGEHFERVMDQALSSMDSQRPDTLIYANSAPISLARKLAPLMAVYPNMRLHLDLRQVSDELDGPNHADQAAFVSWLANSEPRVITTVPDHAEVAKVGELTGSIVHVRSQMPMLRDGEPMEAAREQYGARLLGDATQVKEYPRLLVVDLTGMGGFAATSRIKEAFFGSWPDAKLRLVNVKGGEANRHLVFSNKSGEDLKSETGGDEVMRAAIEYGPEVLYYRAVDDKLVHEFALRLTNTLGIPLVIHIMDDWPTRLAKNNPEQFTYFDHSLRLLFSAAVSRLSIGEKMAEVFKERYGVGFSPFANAVDPASFPPRIKANNPDRPFVMRYTGALAKDMTFESICEVAEAVEDLASELNIRLEIYTRQPWKAEALKRFSSLKSVSVLDQVLARDYNVLLQEADALLIAYNFDDHSQAYVGYSMANKLPEYLASGTPVVVYGPPASATVAYARERGCVQLIEQRDPQIIREKVRSLVMSNDLQVKLGKTGRETAFLRHNIWKVSDDLHRLLISATGARPRVLIGSYTRENSAHWDETNCVAELFSTTLSGSTMIDVGAHHGSALLPFLNQQWKIFAFEPDEKNRQKLLDRLSKHAGAKLVKLDTRAVSNESRSGLSFYRSEESTGISGLSAFHPSHKAAQTVDTVTLTDALAGEIISAVDFLKIDTEGHDLFVLKGFPWDRFSPAVIECEFEDSKTVSLGYTFHDLANYLVEKGYRVYVSEWHPIIRYGICHDWHRLMRYPCELADAKGWGNLLAFRDPIDETALVATVKKVMRNGTESAKVAPSVTPTSPPLITSTPSKQPPVIAAAKPLARVAPASVPEASPKKFAVIAEPKSPATSQPAVRPKAVFVTRLLVRMDQSIEGNNWSAPGRIEGDTVRWAAARERATLALPVQRDCAMLLIVACHPAGAEDRLDGLQVEIDGVVVPHTVHQDLNPVCLVVRMPARTEPSHTPTELALVVPATAAASPPVAGKPVGLAVAAVSVLPTRPENRVNPEIPSPRWSKRLVGLVNRRGKKNLAFPFSHFDGVTYLAKNPDVAENVLAGRMPSALFHYQRYGLKEKRQLTLALTRNPNEGGLADMFDGRAYLDTYPDVAATVRSEAVPSALEHYVMYGRKEGRKVGTSFDGSACRGTALDLVRLEASREAKAGLDGAKLQLNKDIAAQIAQVGSRLTKIESALSSLARATDVEAARAEFRKDLALYARTADLQTIRHDLTVALDALRQEADKRAGQLAEEIQDRFSTAARAADVARMELLTRDRLDRLRAELETVRGELGAKAVALRQELEQGLKERARHDELERVEQRSGDRLERLHAELAAVASVREARELAIAAQMEAVKAGFELAATKVELAEVKQSSLQRDMERETDHVRTQVAGIDTRLSSADVSVRKLSDDLDQVHKQQATQQSRLTHPNLNAFNVLGYQAFPRQLTMANAERLAKHWGPLLGLTIPEKELFYLAHRICQIENACLGRLATSIDSVLLRILVARAAGSRELDIIEIGALFGLGIIALHEAIAPFCARLHFTVIDPLAGYYGKEHRDILTGVPISRSVFDENLRRAGMSGNDVTVIQHLSTDAIAMKRARKTRYGLLVIDGDHRYAGVKHDLESYLGTVTPGGYVLVDDYGNPSWPDVKSYVDAEVLDRKDLELVGSDWHTAVFRVPRAT